MCTGVCLYVSSLCALHVCSAHGGQKRALDPTELDLQMVVSYMGAGI